MKAFIQTALATCAGMGHIPFAPGTFGALLGVITALFIGLYALPFAVLVGYALGWWAITGILFRTPNNPDPQHIVLDEVIGQWIAVLPVLGLLENNPFWTQWNVWLWCGLAFVLFRFFDIVKPWPIHHLESIHGAHGVLLDDVAAGIAAALLQTLIMVMVLR